MHISSIELMLLGVFFGQTVSAAVGSMSKPTKSTGAYRYWYKFLHLWASSLEQAIEEKYNVAMPRVIDETAIEQTTTADSVTTSAVSKVTTENPIQGVK